MSGELVFQLSYQHAQFPTTAQGARVRQPPIRVNIRGRIRTFVPEGLGESPARSAGLAFLKSIRPGRNDRQMLAIAEPRGKPKAQCFDRPSGTDLPFTSFPNPSWTKGLRCLMKSIPKEEIVRIRNNFPVLGLKAA